MVSGMTPRFAITIRHGEDIATVNKVRPVIDGVVIRLSCHPPLFRECPMSRAFVKEDSDAPESLPERSISDLPNYMTQSGHRAIQQRLAELIAERDALVTSELQDRSQLPMLERDIRYFQARLQSAQVIEPREKSPDKVIFGCWVRFVDSHGGQHRYRIVGEDEALEHGSGHHQLISWASPLGRALLGAALEDSVTWPKPSGDLEIEITGIEC